MKKILSLLIVGTMILTLVGCGNKETKDNNVEAKTSTNEESKDKQKDDKKVEEVKVEEVSFEKFEQLLNSYSNDKYYFNLINTIKLKTKDKEKEYAEKASAKLSETLSSNSIDEAKAKVYPYYKNVDGKKGQLTYVITYGEDKKAEKIYEVYDEVSSEYEITFKEIKENDELLKNPQFEKLFAKEFEEKKAE